MAAQAPEKRSQARQKSTRRRRPQCRKKPDDYDETTMMMMMMVMMPLLRERAREVAALRTQLLPVSSRCGTQCVLGRPRSSVRDRGGDHGVVLHGDVASSMRRQRATSNFSVGDAPP